MAQKDAPPFPAVLAGWVVDALECEGFEDPPALDPQAAAPIPRSATTPRGASLRTARDLIIALSPTGPPSLRTWHRLAGATARSVMGHYGG